MDNQANEWKSENYRLVMDERGLLKVFNGKHTLRKTMSDGAGGIRVEISDVDTCMPEDRKLLAAMDRMPVFSACWGGEQDWCKPRRQLREALLNCGFDSATATTILREARKRCGGKPWDYCPRVW
jgi:hypothetical protein